MSSPGGRFPARFRAFALLGAIPLAIPGLAPAAAGHRPAAASPVRHIVVLYLENHSFDSILGYWCRAHHRRCPHGGEPSSVRLASGKRVKPKVEPDIVPAVKHSIMSQRLALANRWDRIVGCKAPRFACIGGYKPAQIPNTTRLATKFAISDNTFSMADSPSWGGHLYAVLGQMDQFTGDNPTEARGHPAGPGWAV